MKGYIRLSWSSSRVNATWIRTGVEREGERRDLNFPNVVRLDATTTSILWQPRTLHDKPNASSHFDHEHIRIQWS